MTFSIIIPAHNAEAYIERALTSIRDQSFPDYELIVVCDRCSDLTGEVAEQYGADKVIHVDHGNDGLTRNDGLVAASGDWVLFMDDDDWFLHEFALREIYSNLDDNIDVLLFGFVFKHIGVAHPLREGNHIWPAVWNKCYRREYIKDLKFRNIKYESDLDWTQRLFKMGPNFRTLDEPLYYYNYMRPGSLSVRKEAERREG